MRDIQTIKNINAESQAKHFIARLNQLKEFKPDGFTMDLYGNEVKRNSGFVVAFQEVNQDTLELIIKQSFLDNNQDKRFVGGWVTLGLGSYASLYDRFLFLTLSFVSLCSHPYGYISINSDAATPE